MESEEAEFRANVLAAHNRLRQLHGVPPLEWSDDCTNDAQTAAQNCEAEGKMFHNTHENQGQNVPNPAAPTCLL